MSDQEKPTLPPPHLRRDKPQLSCNFCRRRKLKCGRQHPCSNCAKRGLPCVYAFTTSSMPRQSPISGSSTSVQDRVKQLENLVINLMQKTGSKNTRYDPLSPTSADTPAGSTFSHPSNMARANGKSDESTAPSEFGSMVMSDSAVSYVNSAHWGAILDEIAELKDHFAKQDEPRQVERHLESSQSNLPFPQLLYGCPKYATKDEILASLPSKDVVDRLVSQFFNSLEISAVITHSRTFLREYESFWEDPQSTPIVWIGFVYAILCCTIQAQRLSLEHESYVEGFSPWTRDPGVSEETCKERIMQCLVLGKYTQGGPFVLETLLIYVAVEHFDSQDSRFGIWMLMGVTVHLALRMGYHRDPRHFSNISPFAGEMRRRVWGAVKLLDLAISAQVGQPRMIKDWQTDTAAPRILLETDFDEDTKELPPSRSETEMSPMLFYVVKGRLLSVFGTISEFTTDIRSFPDDEVMKLDARLREAYQNIPPLLRWRSMSQSITDPAAIILQRLYLEVTYNKAMAVLHQRFLIAAKKDDEHDYSRQTCLKSVMTILEYQQILHDEVKPDGLLHYIRWKTSSLIRHDFLFAVSILCFYLRQHKHLCKPLQGSKDIAEHEKMKELLRKSHSIWLQSSDSSKEAQRAVEALTIVLRTLDVTEEDAAFPESSIPNVDASAADYGTSSMYQDYLFGMNPAFAFFDPMQCDISTPFTGDLATNPALALLSNNSEPWVGTNMY